MDIRDVLKSKSFHALGQLVADDKTKVGDCYRRRMIKAGHWRYLDHDIIREEDTKLWYVMPVEKRLNKTYPAQRTMEDHVFVIYKEYQTLANAVIDIEDERQTTK